MHAQGGQREPWRHRQVARRRWCWGGRGISAPRMALSPSSVPLVQHEPVSVLSRFGRTESDILPNSDCAPSWKLGASFGFFTHAEYPPNTPSSLHPPQNRSVLSAAPMPSAVPEGVPLLARVFESRVSCDLGVTRTPSICVVTTSDQLVQAQYVAARILEERHGAAALEASYQSLESKQQFASRLTCKFGGSVDIRQQEPAGLQSWNPHGKSRPNRLRWCQAWLEGNTARSRNGVRREQRSPGAHTDEARGGRGWAHERGCPSKNPNWWQGRFPAAGERQHERRRREHRRVAGRGERSPRATARGGCSGGPKGITE